jgi:VWFA-related protein
MSTPWLVRWIASACLFATASAAQAPPPSPAFPAHSEVVTVDVVVTDAAGSPVAGLTRDDFTVAEDGRAQPITAFEAIEVRESAPPEPNRIEVARAAVSTNVATPTTGRTLVIVFDDAHLSPLRAEAARNAVQSFLRREGRPGDRVTLVPTSGGAWWSAALPAGAEDLSGALRRLKGLRLPDVSTGKISDYEAIRIHRYRDAALKNELYRRLIDLDRLADVAPGVPVAEAPGQAIVDMMAAQAFFAAEARMKATLGTLARVLSSLTGQRGRKSVLLVSEGFVHDPQMEEFTRVARLAAEANAEVDFVDARSLESDLPETYEAERRPTVDEKDVLGLVARARPEAQGAESVALDSGGVIVRGGNDLTDALGRAARGSRVYYLLGYPPRSAARDGKFRRIQVSVRRPGLTVRARKGYYAPSAERAETRSGALDPDVQRALDASAPAADIPLRMSAYRLGLGADGKTRVRLAAELDPRTLAFAVEGDRSRDTVHAFFVVSSRQTGHGESHARAVELSLSVEALARVRATWLPLQHDFELAAGVYQARLAVLDVNARRVGSVVHDFEVPAASGLYLTNVVLTDMVVAPSRPGEPPRPALIARRAFAAGVRLYCQFDVTGARPDPATGEPRISSGHELRRLDGGVLAHLDPTRVPPGPAGRLSRLLAISLITAQPGDHELVLTVRDEVSGAAVEARERFEVIPDDEAAGIGAVVPSATSDPPRLRPTSSN